MRLLYTPRPDVLSRAIEQRADVIYPDPGFLSGRLGSNLSVPDLLAQAGSPPPAVLFREVNVWDVLTGLDSAQGLKLAFFMDCHVGLAWHKDYAHGFDRVLVALQRYVDDFRKNGIERPVYFPLFFQGSAGEALDHPPETERPYDLAFIGQVSGRPERETFFEALRKELGEKLNVYFGPGREDEFYPRAKIVINECLGDSFWSQRIFQAMGYGSVVLVEDETWQDGPLFENGRHCVSYKRYDAASAAAQIKSMLSDDARRLEVARQGWREVLEKHTVDHRADALVEMISGPVADPPPVDAIQRGYLLGRAYLRMALHWGFLQKISLFTLELERLEEARRLLVRVPVAHPSYPYAAALLGLWSLMSGRVAEAEALWKMLFRSTHACIGVGQLLDRFYLAMNRPADRSRFAEEWKERFKTGAPVAGHEDRQIVEIAYRFFS